VIYTRFLPTHKAGQFAGSPAATAVGTLVIDSASYAVVAQVVVVDCGAAQGRVAGVVGASILVVTVEDFSGCAQSVGAQVAHGAHVVVRALGVVVGVLATGVGVAGIVAADVAVVAVERLTAGAFAVGASFAGGTGIAVIARICVGVKNAAGCGVAGVVGADVEVGANNGLAGDAPAPRTVVSVGAQVVIVAVAVPGLVEAAGLRVAAIFRARIRVVTIEPSAPFTLAVVAGVPHGADVPIGARRRVELMYAPGILVARVVGARVAVVAVKWGSASALAVGAFFVHGTGVAVITGVGVGVENAADGRIACVGCAYVVVVANRGLFKNARFALAVVPESAGVAVVAVEVVGHVDADSLVVAGVVGARISVAAVEGRSGGADPIDAAIVDGARVTVVAVARDYVVVAASVEHTTVRGTRVRVVTVYLSSGQARASGAVVAHGARVVVVTGGLVGGMGAAHGW